MTSVAERTPPTEARPVRRRSSVSIVQSLVIAIGFVMLVGGFAMLAIQYRPYKIPTGSMSPTLEIGDTVLAHTADGTSVGRGDIVVFQDPDWGNATLVKRVAAVGGDTVTGDREGRITVNGHQVDEPYLAKTPVPTTVFSVTVPEGRLFLLGDFRGNSMDSRSHLDVAFGSVPASGVKARVEAVILPLSRAGLEGRTAAFDELGAPRAHQAGALLPAGWTAIDGAALIVLASAAGWAVSLGRKLGGRRKA
ncbi:signal peptidase I [Kitasatospora sp. CB02891]|uniref:signal peptidase I n=1 Tax=Kitasatospora sp. CB02891 TaxID=2020329 RepID=UPI000C2768A5|nr:signal peptidase I [Kitasatospora sp. CB02891]PJN21245.1 signal peptidase I [Kitasatospora sp. CB02891]